MMTNDNEKQPDELQQQPTLPLLYLPIELAEEVSMYFEGRDAVKLLRVSRSFHSLFLPRVWVDLSTFDAIKDDVTKQLLLEKYGHFVRIISFTDLTTSEFKFDWLPFVKRAIYLKVIIDYESTAEAEMLIKLIKQSKMLRTLDLHFDDFDTNVKYDELAAAINGLNHLGCLSCEFVTVSGASGAGSEWKHAANFVDLLHPPVRSKLRLKMIFNTDFSEEDVRGLAPSIVELRAAGEFACTTYLAHEFFGAKDNDGQPLVFPQLKELKMTSCCFKNEYSGIKSIMASRFPQLQHLYFDDDPCDLLGRDDPRRNEHETYNWQPEYSGYAHIIIPSQSWQYLTYLDIGIVSSSILMDIIDLNPQLQQLRVGSEYSNVPLENDASQYNHDEFQLDTILNRLPRLGYFSIGRLNSRLVVNPAAIPTKRRYNIDIAIGCQMSIEPSATAYVLQMPQLTNLSFIYCVLANIDETIQLLQGNVATCGVKWFQWFPIEWNQDLALAMTNKMPQLEQFVVDDCPKEHRAVFEAKCQFHY
ncbi:hypothetical protein GQ42DRAFT_5805 [Ramicandelaber brevisporus]|nr:hypothetical protein GQ42DRAFT_5805 [Ramicandelaber brevisporus]